MFNWAKQTLANAVGTEEPIYGPSAIRSVAEQTATTSYTELNREGLKWEAMKTTNVETASFYLMADNGHLALAQIIYSNVMSVHTTCQFNCKIFYPGQSKPNLWSSDQLSNVEFSEDKNNFYAENCALELSEDGTSYTIKSITNPASVVDITFTRTAPGFVVGKDGKSYYGTDPQAPWGSMRHAFWPRNKVVGSIVTKDGPIDFAGKGLYSMALQGMKPHHAAAKWTFADFQGAKYSAILMSFITPPSYGSTVVTVGGIAKDGEIITAGTTCSATHKDIKSDVENEWPEPQAIEFKWTGTTKDGKTVEAVLDGPLDERLDRVDVMAEVPRFVKNIVAGTVGTKPYIYQYSPSAHPIALKIKIGETEEVDEGRLFSEATFISE